MFWEDYMETFAETLFSFQEKFDNDITDIHFQYHGRSTSFLTDGGFGQNLSSKSDTNEVIYTLNFDLDRRSDRYTQSGLSLREEIDKQQQINFEKQQEEINDDEDDEVDDEDEYKSKKFTSQYIRFISTPMGGMTKWKRR